MKKDLFSLREAEIFLTLKDIENREFVIIGGYAVNAYTLPRFSVDCDIVIMDENELGKIEKVLVKRGYKKEQNEADAQYKGSFARYEKKLDNNFIVSMDVLIGEVSDRLTQATFSSEWIFEHSSERMLRGKTITEELQLRIIDLDALLVMKIIAARATDIRDVFMMVPKAKDRTWISSEINLRYDLKNRMKLIIDKVNSNQFKDGLAGVYGSIDEKLFEKHRNALISLLDF